MKLDKGHLDQFEDIAPPMRHALTLPVEIDKPLAGVHIYVCASTFNRKATRQDVLNVATALRVVDSETYTALIWAADKLMEVPGGHGHVIDILRRLARGDA